MPLYRVCVRGENFLVDLGGEPELLTFQVVHYVRAADHDEASKIAFIRTRKDPYFKGVLLNTVDNPTRLLCETIERVWFTRPWQDGRMHFTIP